MHDATLPRVLTRAGLIEAGYTAKTITRDVKRGVLVRLRRDRYAITPSADGDTAVRIGGRVSCLTAIAATGAFTMGDERVHVQVERRGSRLRSPNTSKERWLRSRASAAKIRLHWSDCADTGGSLESVPFEDALRQFIRCQPPREVVATLDSLLRSRTVKRRQLREVFASLPPRYRILLTLVDPRAESGPESLLRLMLRQLGIPFEIQVSIPGVGRVDFVIGGVLIIECDSRAHHEGWESQQKDRIRDVEAARLGYATIRLMAADVMYHPDDVRDVLRDVARAWAPRVA
ncbi:DUF559 domain-containing protein [Microbacterium sp. ARD31]|uniref:DUF559 domain-containing protein n=1 Tax=Microbacterium sp. ARD31 TaxID=2962576 RepID=UPI0028814F4B|nr:DUF559 domain-containing protein [Microbacterium sp. ARD31]MDT0185130.1 DUF559 domain-containing protein [Microbacterium sp. ARD31]